MSQNLRILVVDDDRRMAKTLTDILKIKGYEALSVHSGNEALEKMEEALFDCVISDIKMPNVNGVELYRAIKAKQPQLLVVLMTAYSSDSLVEEGLEEGAIAVLNKPLDIALLLDFFSFIRKEQSVTIVDDDPHFCKTLGDILKERGFVVNQVTDSHGVIEQIDINRKIIIILDIKLNDINGLNILQEIRERYPNLPVILVTAYRAEMSSAVEAALKIGAYTCLYKPFEIEKFFQLLEKIRHQELSQFLRE